MIVFKKSRYSRLEALMPFFFGLLALGLVAGPMKDAIEFRKTNTDALTSGVAARKIEKIATLEEGETAEIAVPKLGGGASNLTTSVASGATATAEPANPCAETPTPGVNQLSICGRLIPLQAHSGETYMATPPNGVALKQDGYNFIFGHNSSDVFGGLHALLQPGDPLIVNFGGAETTYRFSYYDYNQGGAVIDLRFLYSPMGLMTCAPGVTDGRLDTSRLGFVFTY